MLVGNGERLRAQTYTAKFLDPNGYAGSQFRGESGGIEVGYGVAGALANGPDHAQLFNFGTGSVTDLHPAGFYDSEALAVSGNLQVGEGATTLNGKRHALVWSGSANSVVDLTPADMGDTVALGISGTRIVGFGDAGALLWDNLSPNPIVLTPAGYQGCIAYGVAGNTEVGMGTFYGLPMGEYEQRALMWSGSAASVVNLHPAGFTSSEALGVFGTQQVGDGAPNGSLNMSHALLWSGTAASAVDLNPAGYGYSSATATNGTAQVGFIDIAAHAGFGEQAMVWHGTAASAINLHQYLAGLGPNFEVSFAWAIDAAGNIYGSASDGNKYYPVEWTLVTPEPSTMWLAAGELAMVPAMRRRDRI